MQFHSGMNLESLSNNVAGKEVVDVNYPIIYGSINLENNTHKKGESSYAFCEICEDVLPLLNILM